jgi:subtilase-type serine protease
MSPSTNSPTQATAAAPPRFQRPTQRRLRRQQPTGFCRTRLRVAATCAEPFANLGYQRYHRDSYQEKGGAAALQVDGQTQDNFSTTFGLRLAHLNSLENGISLTPRMTAGGKHTYGDVSNSTRESFVAGGTASGFGYSGEIGSNRRNRGVWGVWVWGF